MTVDGLRATPLLATPVSRAALPYTAGRSAGTRRFTIRGGGLDVPIGAAVVAAEGERSSRKKKRGRWGEASQ